jgi:Domain of unknown function (DUF4349)
MRIVPFPQPPGAPGEPTPAELEAALHGDAVGPSAEYWRDLRADVRALAPPLPPELERRLRERVKQSADQRTQPTDDRRFLAHARAVCASLGRRLVSNRPRQALAGCGVVLAAAVVALIVLAPWRTTTISQKMFEPHAAVAKESSAASGSSSASAIPHAAKSQLAPFAREATPGAASRVQQRAASLTLASKPAEVQEVSDRVAQLAVREGGVVQSSQVHLESGTAGEANLRLSLPSAHLSAALASLARLAPTRAESQQLQDITDEYDAAKRKLSDAVAERQALLRALSRASTQGAIESLHARLSLASGAITSDREAFASISKRGSNANVEVSVIGDAHASSGGLSVSRGLHDAGDVLCVSLAVLLIALAVLVPLAILAALLSLAWRSSRRRLRERALS